MTTDDAAPNDAAANDPDRSAGRRRFVLLSGTALAAGLAGCSDLGIGGDSDDEQADDSSPGSTPVNQETETGTDTETQVATETESDGPTETADADSEGATETETETEEFVHEHGHLYLEVDGERHPFTDPKYYHPSDHPDAEASEDFHFHDDGDDSRWHMHDERLTLAAALGELPDIEYVSNDGAHVINFEGDTYEDGRDGTTIEIRQGGTSIDPTDYELRDGDEIAIEITTGDSSN